MIVSILLLIAAYLLGSIPSAVWIGKRFYGIDIREHGSRNAGATNTLRVLGRKAAIPVFIIDFLKGFVAVKLYYLAPAAMGEHIFFFKLALTVAVVAGHIFPIFANFKGGKGVATMAGAVMAVSPIPVLMCAATFIVVLAIFNYVSLGSMVAGLMFPFYAWLYTKYIAHTCYPPLIIFAGVVAVALLITHRKNIKRIFNGTESKIYLFPKHAQSKRAERESSDK